MISNHIALNLVTKGLLNISNITKGMLLLGYKITPRIIKKGGSPQYDDRPIFKKYEEPEDFIKDVKETEDIDYIEVTVDWNKKIDKKNKKIESELIKRQIEVILLRDTGKNIRVEIT